MRIEFEVYSDSLADRDIVARYWALTADGKFAENVTDLLPYADIKNSQRLVKYIQEISSAWDTEQACLKCGKFASIRSRNEFRLRPITAAVVCGACRKNKQLEEKRAAEEDATKLRERLVIIAAENQKATIDYSTIDDDIALILIALEKATSPRLLSGTFRRDECRLLAPQNCDSFIQRLSAAKVILDCPAKSAPDAYYLKEGSVLCRESKVAYFLLPDRCKGKNEDAFEIIASREFRDHGALRRLWLDYAVSDCMAYLRTQSNLHALETTNEAEAEICSLLRTALHTYSVAQLWFILWKVVRDASSLSTRIYYNSARAAATIPGKIKMALEKVKKGQIAIKSWSRPDYQPAGTLGDVLCERFGIDEKTAGREVMSLFPLKETNDGGLIEGVSVEKLEEMVCFLMHRAIAYNYELDVILHFANRIRNRDTVEQALDSIFTTYPQLASKQSHW
ncbi:hypothetical protein [Rhodocyclus tenuis]|uniref:hypothetical protein n=1 Tax=Rhodocyclus tenuis TaxID=1066 RepID=UPI001902FEDA|nr:hypothetical protein [Rhodocyclus tenuis]